MRINLTDSAITKAARVAVEDKKRRDLADKEHRGLWLRLTPAGSKTWFLSCRDQGGKMRWYPLGTYPAVGIADAREAARVMRHKVRYDGEDPIAERRRARQKAKAAAEGIGTLDALVTLYEARKGHALRSWPQYRASIGYVFGAFRNRPLADLKLADLQLAADGYPAQQQAALAVRCLRPILKWASAPGREYAPAELAKINPPATPKRRDRVLSRAELRAILPALKASTRPHAAAMRLMLLTLCRREEVCGARWRDLDLQAGTLTIPAERSKNRQPHVITLSTQARDLLEARLPVDDEGQRIEPEPEALIFGTGTGGALSNWNRETKAIRKASGVTGWHRHDLRRTGATLLGEMGELPDIIEAALNHTSIRSPLAATYNRSRYRPQVAMALQRLADALDGIEADAAEVVRFPQMA